MMIQHKKLDRKIWHTKTNTVRDNVRNTILYTAWGCIDFIRNANDIMLKNTDIKDIILYGETTNFFYNNKSEIHVCIITDLTRIQKKQPRIHEILNAMTREWARTRICKIYKHNVIIHFADIDKPRFGSRHACGGQYSVMNNNWIFKPIKISDSELHEITKKARETYKRIMHDYRIVRKNKFPLYETKYIYNNIQQSFMQSMIDNYVQPIMPMFLAYKKLQRKHILQRLTTKIKQRESERFVLN